MERTYEQLLLDKLIFVHWKIMGISARVFESLFSLTENLNMAVVHHSEVIMEQTLITLFRILQFCAIIYL
jgi:hypothetical protein